MILIMISLYQRKNGNPGLMQNALQKLMFIKKKQGFTLASMICV